MNAREQLDLARAAYDRHGPKDTDHQLALVPFRGPHGPEFPRPIRKCPPKPGFLLPRDRR